MSIIQLVGSPEAELGDFCLLARLTFDPFPNPASLVPPPPNDQRDPPSCRWHPGSMPPL